MSSKKEIQAWLNGPRDYDEGVAIYAKTKHNARLLALFTKKRNRYNIQKLEYELIKAAKEMGVKAKAKKTAKPKQPITVMQAKKQFEKAKKKANQPLPKNPPPAPEAPDVLLRKISYEQLPEKLQPYYLKAIQLHKEAKAIHWDLARGVIKQGTEQAKEACHNIVTRYDENTRYWQWFEHWEETGELPLELCKDPSTDFSKMGKADLLKKQLNLRSGISKDKKRAEDKSITDKARNKAKERLQQRLSDLEIVNGLLDG